MSRIKCYMCKNFSRWGLYTGWCKVKKEDKAIMSSKCKHFSQKYFEDYEEKNSVQLGRN